MRKLSPDLKWRASSGRETRSPRARESEGAGFLPTSKRSRPGSSAKRTRRISAAVWSASRSLSSRSERPSYRTRLRPAGSVAKPSCTIWSESRKRPAPLPRGELSAEAPELLLNPSFWLALDGTREEALSGDKAASRLLGKVLKVLKVPKVRTEAARAKAAASREALARELRREPEFMAGPLAALRGRDCARRAARSDSAPEPSSCFSTPPATSLGSSGSRARCRLHPIRCAVGRYVRQAETSGTRLPSAPSHSKAGASGPRKTEARENSGSEMTRAVPSFSVNAAASSRRHERDEAPPILDEGRGAGRPPRRPNAQEISRHGRRAALPVRRPAGLLPGGRPPRMARSPPNLFLDR